MKKALAAQQFRNLLRTSGLKATPGRLAILMVLENAKKPLSIEKITSGLGKHTADLATVYRTLHSLAQTGAVRQVDLRHGHAHYELASPADHHHLICTKCGRIEDFTGCDTNQLIQEVVSKSKQFKKVTEHSMELFGICKTCAR